MWKEIIAPLIAIEFVSGDGSEGRDTTSLFAGDESKAGKRGMVRSHNGVE